jgi:hypothetical protein
MVYGHIIINPNIVCADQQGRLWPIVNGDPVKIGIHAHGGQDKTQVSITFTGNYAYYRRNGQTAASGVYDVYNGGEVLVCDQSEAAQLIANGAATYS